MNRLLYRIDNWLLMTYFKNRFFEKRIRWQLHSLISYILYPEFRKSWSLSKIIYSNRYAIILTNILALLLVSAFYLGGYRNYKTITKLKSEAVHRNLVTKSLVSSIIEKNETISNLSVELKSRGYLEYKVVSESKIEHIDNLRLVPDSIFFLMVEEADKYEIPYVIFFRIMEKESKFKFVANSEGSGAMGYMQVMPSTFQKYYNKLDLEKGHTPGNNIRVAAKLIRTIYDFWDGKFKSDETTWEYTLAEYGCGRAPMQNGNGGYFIPESVRPGINYVMKYYKK